MKDINRPPVHTVVEQQGYDDPPDQPGYYWFYGDPWMGQMGGHYAGTIDPDKRLMLVEVERIANGLLAISKGQFIPLTKWDGKQKGYEGKWMSAIIPDISTL